jgi:hypothetical protein
MSADGTTIGGWAYGYLGYIGDQEGIRCHTDGAGKLYTQSVDFPNAFDQLLANGDTAGQTVIG